jgi:Uncharacterized protein conserved in bacteria (DUF2255)
VSATWTDEELRRVGIDAGTQASVDAAYHAKYDRYGQQIVGTVTGARATPVTLRLIPQNAG